MRILGIDPGIAIVGWGVIDYDRMKGKAVDYGAITTGPEMKTEERIAEVFRQMQQILAVYKPEAVSIEELFFNTNQKTGIIVAEARGVLVLAATLAKVPIYEYTPLQIKSAVVGYGRAEKKQVIDMVTRLLKLSAPPKPDDTADALAAALCHAHSGTSALADLYNHPTTMRGKIQY